MQTPPLVQIGPITDDPTESVSAVNKALIAGLAGQYAFNPVCFNRTIGNTRQSKLNAVNSLYFAGHVARWTGHLIRNRPAIAHYAINSGWALEKGLIFFKLARLFGVKTIGHLHSGSFLTFWNSLPTWRKRHAFRELSRLNAIVVLSDGWREAVANNIGLSRDRLFVVNNPIDPSFEDAALRMPIDRSANSILSLGVIGQQKGVLDLLDASDRLHRDKVNFTLHLVGPEREPGILERIHQKIRECSLASAITVQGSVTGQPKIELFERTSIFILPSYFENFPLVALEAAAAGHAIITTPVGAVPEFFRDGVSAVFIEPGSVTQLTEAIRRLLANPAERERLAENARAMFIRKLARSEIMSSMDRVYRHVLGRPQRAHIADSAAVSAEVPAIHL